jgi:hypothetical protein
MTAAGEARAQYWLSDRALTEGRGFRAGDFEFHPGVGLEFGYDSNALYRPPGQEVPALRLRGTAHLALSTLGPQRSANPQGGAPSALPIANFRAQVAVTWQQFIQVPGFPDPMNGAPISGPGVSAGFRLELFPGRTWQFHLYDQFDRIIQGSADPGINLYVFNRDQNVGGFNLIYAPNGGIVDVRLGYENRFTYFENNQFNFLTTDQNDITLRARWRFLPKTALLWELGFNPSFYLNTTGSSTLLANSFPFRTRIGANGLLTERIRVLAMVGYQGTYAPLGDNASTVIAQADFQYIFSPLTSFSLGFIRDVNPSYLGGYSIRNNIYAKVNQSFSGRFYVSAEISGGRYEYGFVADTSGARNPSALTGSADYDAATGRWYSWRVQGQIFGEYRPADWLGINVSGTASANLTDVSARIDPMTMQSLAYTKFEAYLGVRVNW